MEGRDAPLWRCPRLHSPEARSPPRRADWAVRIQVPVREGGAGSSSSAAAHRGAPTTPLAPGRAVGSVAVGAQPGTAPALPGPRCPVEAVGVDPRRAGVAGATPPPPPHPGAPIRAPVPTGVLGGGHRRSAIADQDRVGVGGPPGSTRMRGGGCAGSAADSSAGPPGSTRARAVRPSRVRASVGDARFNAAAGGPVDAAARGTVATPVPFAPSVSARARAVRWRSDPATQKGGRRGSFTLRPALLPSRSGAMTPFPGRAGAAAHPKDTHRPPFSAPPTPRAATAGPPEASTAPGPSSTPARTATAGAASRSPRGNHRTAPGPARISRIRADAESAAPAGGVAGASWPASASRRSAALARGRRDPIPVPAPSRSAPVGPRERHITRENVCPGYVLAGCPAISRVKRRSRGGRGVRCGSRGAPPRRRGRGARRGPSRPPSSVRPTRTSAPTPGRGPARARRRDSGDQVAGLGAPRTRTGTATGPGPDSAPDPRHHGRTGEPPAADSGPARTRLAGPEARLGRGWFA